MVDKDAYGLELSRYIHLNPMKARVVERPEVYHWSSCVHYFKKLPLPDLLETSFVSQAVQRLDSQRRRDKHLNQQLTRAEKNKKVESVGPLGPP